MADLTLHRLTGENDEQFIWRLASAKDAGLLDMSWTELARIFNDELRDDDTFWNESAYRKKYQQAALFYRNVFSKMQNTEFLEDFEEQRRLLEKEKVKFRDERTEYNRVIRREARKEAFLESVQKAISDNTRPIDLPVSHSLLASDNDILMPITDVHTGIEIENFRNTFNEDVLAERLAKYTADVLEIAKQHKSENLYIVISEVLSGIIHYTLRLQNNMDMMEQFKYVSELIANMIVQLAPAFHHVFVYTAPGNHSRISPKKEEALDGENMDVLLPFYLKARLQNLKSVLICDNKLDPEVPVFDVRGQLVMAAHGHKDSPESVVQNFTMWSGRQPDIVLLGHRHTNGYLTVYDSKVVQSGCISGADDFIMSKRKCNKPEQAVCVIDDRGLRCVYDIRLD